MMDRFGRGNRASAAVISLGLIAVLAFGAGLGGCGRASHEPGESPGPGPASPAAGGPGPGPAPPAAGAGTSGGAAQEQAAVSQDFAVEITDWRKAEPSVNFDDFGPELNTVVKTPGQNVVVGEGLLSLTVYFNANATFDKVEPLVVLDPPPKAGLRWFDDWDGVTMLTFAYEPGEAPEGLTAVFKAGLPLRDGSTLASDFPLTVTRAKEETVTAWVEGFPWVTAPYTRHTACYTLPSGLYVARFEFSKAPAKDSAEEALRKTAGVKDVRWEDARHLVATVELATPGSRVVLNLNGVSIPGSPCLGRQTPLVLRCERPVCLVGIEAQDLSDQTRPLPPKAEVVPLPLPLEPGGLSLDGSRVLLWETAELAVEESGDGPDHLSLPWIVPLAAPTPSAASGTATQAVGTPLCLAPSVHWPVAAGWAKDGRLIVADPSGDGVLGFGPTADLPAVLVPAGLDPQNPGDRRGILSASVSPDGRCLAWLELEPVDGGGAVAMKFVLLDLDSGRLTEYPGAAPVVVFEVVYERPEIVWLPAGKIGIWRAAPDARSTSDAAVLNIWDEERRVFAPSPFLAPDGQPIYRAMAWTMEPTEDAWREEGLVLAVTPAGKLTLATPKGRVALKPGDVFLSDTYAFLRWCREGRCSFSPAGDFLAVQGDAWTRVFRCPGGEFVRQFDGQLLGWAPDGRLWLVAPTPAPTP